MLGRRIRDKGQGEAACERLKELFELDPDIDEIGFVVDTEENHFGELVPDREKGISEDLDHPCSFSDPEPCRHAEHGSAFVLCEHKLGIAYWCIPSILAAAHAKLNRLLLLLKDPESEPNIDRNHVEKSILESTRAILLINSDFYSGWNFRKIMLTRLQSEPLLRKELKLCNVVFSAHPKVREAWVHRRWVLELLPEFSNPTSYLYPKKIFQKELSVCFRACEQYPKNYYAWSHRRWLVGLMIQSKHVMRELRVSKSWTDLHVSDYSGFHHRQVVLLRILSISSDHESLGSQDDLAFFNPLTKKIKAPFETCKECSIWKSELEYVARLNECYPGHETLWSYRRFLVAYWLRMKSHHLISSVGERQADEQAGGLDNTGELQIEGTERHLTKLLLLNIIDDENLNVEHHMSKMLETQEIDPGKISKIRKYCLTFNLWILESLRRIAIASSANGEKGFETSPESLLEVLNRRRLQMLKSVDAPAAALLALF